jgi:hypothetical protein
MSMQQGAKTTEELLEIVEDLANTMRIFYDTVNEIVITFNEEKGEFTITSD